MPLPPSAEYRVIGPPGTGKTTYVAKQAAKAVKAGQKVLVCALTKAAAAAVPQLNCQVGTLHSFCHQALGRPPLTEDHMADFQTRYPQYHWYANAKAAKTKGAGPSGDRLLDAYQRRRADLKPQRATTTDANFVERYENWKQKEWPAANPEAGGPLMDFTDLILHCLEYVPQAPGKPDLILADEAQDLDPLELQLLRKWGAAAGRLILVGDPQQNLYFWRGAQPSAFAQGKLPRGHVRHLKQSYRVPRAVDQAAKAWLKPQANATQVKSKPLDKAGAARSLDLSLDTPEDLVDHLQDNGEQGQTVMILASCAYLLQPLLRELRDHGIPFHNPYRTDSLPWNPLTDTAGNGWAVRRLAHFLGMHSGKPNSPKQLTYWLDALAKTAIIKPGGRKALNRLLTEQPDTPLSPETLLTILTKPAATALARGNLAWYQNRLYDPIPAAYPLKVAANYGRAALLQEPSLVIGTIHSVKGGQADVVYLFPDLSPAGWRDWNGPAENRDSIYRLFYVGMTRAKDTIYLGQPSEGRYYVEFPDLADSIYTLPAD